MMKRIPTLLLIVFIFGCSLVHGFIKKPSFSLSNTRIESRSSGLFMIPNNNDDDETKKSKKLSVARAMNESHGKFVAGEELKNLRLDLSSLRQNLQWAEALNDVKRIESLTKAIKVGESRDPDHMLKKALKIVDQTRKMKDASQEEKDYLIEKWEKIAEHARDHVQEFNLEGLWVGSYGDHGIQMINVTYMGDTLVASKVTGDRNVPRGEITFTASLTPGKGSVLPPFQFASKHQGSDEYQRFPGRGQVSRKGFKDNRFVEGQMIMFEEKFSFVWVPTKHHVLFSRPSPETTLRLLRDTISKEDEIENMREHIACCFEMDMTTCLARQQDPTNFEPLQRIPLQEDLDKAEQTIKQKKERSLLWQLNQWRRYIDQALDKH